MYIHTYTHRHTHIYIYKQGVRQKSSFGVFSNFHFYKFLKQNKRDSVVSGRQKREAANCLKYSNEGIRSALFIPEMFMLVTHLFFSFSLYAKIWGQVFYNLHVDILSALRWIVVNVLQSHCEPSGCGMHSSIVVSSNIQYPRTRGGCIFVIQRIGNCDLSWI